MRSDADHPIESTKKTAEKIAYEIRKTVKKIINVQQKTGGKKTRRESIQQSINVNERKTFRHVHSKQEQKKQNNRFSDYNRNLSIIYICACIFFIMYSLHGRVELLVSCVPCAPSVHHTVVMWLIWHFAFIYTFISMRTVKRNMKARAQKKHIKQNMNIVWKSESPKESAFGFSVVIRPVFGYSSWKCARTCNKTEFI